MQLVEDGHPIIGNGLCFICEAACDRRFPVINTRFEFDPDFHSPLVGPKYVCAQCAGELGRLVGLVPKEENEPVIVEVDRTPDILKRIEAQTKPPKASIAKAT